MASTERRLKLVRIFDDPDRVPDDLAVDVARQVSEIPSDAEHIEGPDRELARLSVAVVFAHPTFEVVPPGQSR